MFNKYYLLIIVFLVFNNQNNLYAHNNLAKFGVPTISLLAVGVYFVHNKANANTHKNCDIVHIKKPISDRDKKIFDCLNQANEHPITWAALEKCLNK